MAIQFRTKKHAPKTASPRVNRARAFPRANLPGRVYIHDEERLFIAPLDNISAGGIFIEGLTSFPQGRDVKIVVKSPMMPQAIQACGAVVRIETDRRKGLAVQFSQISREAQEIIQSSVEYVQARAAAETKTAA